MKSSQPYSEEETPVDEKIVREDAKEDSKRSDEAVDNPK